MMNTEIHEQDFAAMTFGGVVDFVWNTVGNERWIMMTGAEIVKLIERLQKLNRVDEDIFDVLVKHAIAESK